jgi:DNA-binding IclR family transcriptional regulator
MAVQKRGASTSAGSASPLQTLSRGLTALEILAEADAPLTIAELAVRLGLHHSITYRIVRTLEHHRLVVRDPVGGLRLGPQLAALARSVSHDLQASALPELTKVANALEMTAFLAVADGDDVTTLVSVEPRGPHATVAQRPGTRHSIAVGAPGAAIRSILTTAERRALTTPDLPERDVNSRGYAFSHDEVIKGLASVAVPLRIKGQPPGAVAVVYLHREVDTDGIAAALQEAARNIEQQLG